MAFEFIYIVCIQKTVKSEMIAFDFNFTNNKTKKFFCTILIYVHVKNLIILFMVLL